MSYLRYLCLFACSGVSFLFCVSSSMYLVYPVLPFSLDCPFFLAPSVFSNVYLKEARMKELFVYVTCIN